MTYIGYYDVGKIRVQGSNVQFFLNASILDSVFFVVWVDIIYNRADHIVAVTDSYCKTSRASTERLRNC